jgi:Uma2 family endonuclease
MVATTTKPVTVEELWELRDEPYRLALIDGELYRMPGAGGTHGALLIFLGMHLGPFVVRRRLGKMYGDTGFRLFPDRETTLFPDIAFVRAERVPSEEQEERFYPKLLDDKLAQYMEAGTPCVVRLYPRTRSVRVYRPGREVAVLGTEDTFTVDDVLPGFTIRVGDLFEPPISNG